MNLVETLDFYALKNGSTDLFLMLKDYVIDERIDRDKMNRIIIKELGNATPFTNQATILKFAIEEFFEKYEGNITRLIDTMYLEYNPLNTKSIERELSEKQNKTTEVDVTGTEGEDRTSEADITNTDDYTNTQNLNSEDKVSAYDSNEYQPKEKNITTDQTVHEGDTTSHIESTVETDKTSTEKTEGEEHIGRGLTESIEGKDGDSSYQTLIEQERKLAEFNIFNWIIKLMRKELFLLVY